MPAEYLERMVQLSAKLIKRRRSACSATPAAMSDSRDQPGAPRELPVVIVPENRDLWWLALIMAPAIGPNIVVQWTTRLRRAAPTVRAFSR